ncbi:hypothetical protein TNCV_4657751 [Trichonephila clavipes]|nr:hypothetical protein TNCV_4657751 [Trichonephila clavipes]
MSEADDLISKIQELQGIIEQQNQSCEKPTFINRLSISEEQRVRKLLGREELCDRKPCQFLRHLRSLAVDMEIKPTLLRSLLLHVQAILQGQSTLEPDQMADIADRIMEVALLTSMPFANSIDPIVASASPRVSVTLESLAERVGGTC